MIYSLSGELKQTRGRFIVVGVGGIEFKIAVPISSESNLPRIGEKITIFTFVHVREGGIDIYGFSNEAELSLFELLVSVSGIGPKSAISILSVAPSRQIAAAISRGEAELLQKSSGVGKKTAERIVLELRDKVVVGDDEVTVELMQSDQDVIGALVSLGYTRGSAKDAVKEIDSSITDTSDRLKEALKHIKG